MSTSESESAYNRTAINLDLSLAERINELLLAADSSIDEPIRLTRTHILKRLDLEPTLERRQWVTGTFPELREMGWQISSPGAVTEEWEEILAFQRQC